MQKEFFIKRQKSRYYALQALYSWSITQDDLNLVEKNILYEKDLNKIDYDHFKKLIYGISEKLTILDDSFAPYLNIGLKELDTIELNILRIAVFEFQECKEIPFKVVINEALELSKKFGATDSYKFINGVLDKYVKNSKQN